MFPHQSHSPLLSHSEMHHNCFRNTVVMCCVGQRYFYIYHIQILRPNIGHPLKWELELWQIALVFSSIYCVGQSIYTGIYTGKWQYCSYIYLFVDLWTQNPHGEVVQKYFKQPIVWLECSVKRPVCTWCCDITSPLPTHIHPSPVSQCYCDFTG